MRATRKRPTARASLKYLAEQINLVGREKQFSLLKEAQGADQDAAAGQGQKRLKIGFGIRLFSQAAQEQGQTHQQVIDFRSKQQRSFHSLQPTYERHHRRFDDIQHQAREDPEQNQGSD